MSSRWTATLARHTGSGKVWTVFQIACRQPLLAGEAPQSSGPLKGLAWVGQKKAAMQGNAAGRRQNKSKGHGYKSQRPQGFFTQESWLKINARHLVPILFLYSSVRCLFAMNYFAILEIYLNTTNKIVFHND